MKTFDLAIIGGGPVGLFAAHFAHLHGLNPIILEAQDKLGGQPALLYPTKDIQDIPLFNHISASKLTSHLIEQVQTDQIPCFLNFKASQLSIIDEEFLLNESIIAKNILIASGNGAFQAKKLPFALDERANSHVHYYIENHELFAGKRIAVLGGGDSALDWANELADIAKVSLIHRRDTFRGLDSSVSALKAKQVEILTPYLPVSLNADYNLQLELKKVQTKESFFKEFDEILVAYGFKADNSFAKQWGLSLKASKFVVNEFMQTNLAGIYAIGDCALSSVHLPVIALGFGQAQIAITEIIKTRFPEKTMTIHSTSIKEN